MKSDSQNSQSEDKNNGNNTTVPVVPKTEGEKKVQNTPRVFHAYRQTNPMAKLGKDNYSGCFHKVGFRTNREIFLVGLNFFGPAAVETADYKIRLLISRDEEGWSFWNSFCFCFGNGPYYKRVDLLPEPMPMKPLIEVKGCKKGEMFYVPLPKPVRITPNLWTDIKFELIGPDTECLMFGFGDEDYIDSDKVQFQFLEGSRQLYALRFTFWPELETFFPKNE